MITYDTANEIKSTVLKFTAKNGFTKILKHLIDFGYDIHSNDDIVLIYAIENNHIPIV